MGGLRAGVLTIAFLSLLVGCSNPLSLDDAKAQLEPFRSSSPYIYLCNGQQRDAFRSALKDYTRSLKASGYAWLATGDSGDWAIRAGTAGYFAGLLNGSDFGPFNMQIGELAIAAAEERDLYSPSSARLRPGPKFTSAEFDKAAKVACSQLVSYGLTLGDNRIQAYRRSLKSGRPTAPSGYRMLFIDEEAWAKVVAKEEEVREVMRNSADR